MNRACVVVLLIAGCGDAKLEYKVTSNARTARGPASWAEMRDVRADIAVSGPPDGPYLAAIQHEVRAAAEPARGTIKVTSVVPDDDSGTFKTTVTLDVTWWALPETKHGTGELEISVDYANQSPAKVGRAVGTIIVKRLAEMRPTRASLPLLAASPATAISMGHDIACSLHADKTVHCWGHQIGELVGPVPTTIPLPPAVEIATGDRAVCARTEDGSVHCIGKRQQDEKTVSPKALKVCGLDGKATKLALGSDTGCALTETGDVYCWTPAVPTGMDCNAAAPTEDAKKVAGVEKATHLAVGFWGACALVSGGNTKCWKNRTHIAESTRLPPGVDVLVGFDPCVVEASGQITCDRPRDGTDVLVTAKVTPGSKVVIDPMWGCAIAADAQLSCWGVLPEGTTSDAHRAASRTPTPVLADVTSVDLNLAGACMVTRDGAVHCWGKGYFSPALPENDAPDPTKVPIY